MMEGVARVSRSVSNQKPAIEMMKFEDRDKGCREPSDPHAAGMMTKTLRID